MLNCNLLIFELLVRAYVVHFAAISLGICLTTVSAAGLDINTSRIGTDNLTTLSGNTKAIVAVGNNVP